MRRQKNDVKRESLATYLELLTTSKNNRKMASNMLIRPIFLCYYDDKICRMYIINCHAFKKRRNKFYKTEVILTIDWRKFIDATS